MISDLKLSVICRKATHADPASRFPDASSLADQLTRWMTPKASRAMAPIRPLTLHRAKPVKRTNRPASGAWSVLRNCAIITFLLCAIHLTWGVYQTKQESFARQQQEPPPEPVIRIVKAEPKPAARFTPSRSFEMASTAASRDSTLESFEFGTVLAAGN